MTKRYIIRRIGKGGYWSDLKRNWVPAGMCTTYADISEAMETVTIKIPVISPSSEMVCIEEVYVRIDSVSL